MQLGDVFWLTVLVIFLVTIVGALVRRLRKDKCLKLLHGHEVTYLNRDGRPLWGELWASSHGLELRYDAPYTTRRGIIKASYLVFPDEAASCRALCRVEGALSDAARAERRRQVERSFAPGILRRGLRALRNFVNIIRDALAKTLNLFVGAFAARGTTGQAVGSQSKDIGALGDTLLGTVANAYEPLLERHVGKPVVLELGGGEFPGYLVDYTEHFLAVFNVEHAAEEEIDLETSESTSRAGLELALEGDRAIVACTGPDALVVDGIESDGRRLDLDVCLLPGSKLDLAHPTRTPLKLKAARTRRIDIVCPRGAGRVRFGSTCRDVEQKDRRGVAPDEGSN
jgi:hypothetical protein